MKTILTIFFIFSIFITVSAQKKMTDREFEGLKGAVKSVSIEYMPVSESDGVTPKNKRVVWGIKLFDKDGKQEQEIYPNPNRKLIYKVIDGFKTFKTVEIAPIGKKTVATDVRITVPLEESEPIEKPEKLVPPDERFNQKYTYEYDSQGRVIKEREFLNTGKLTQLKTFKYDKNGRLKEEVRNDTSAITKNSYKYDDKGNLIENVEDRDIKGPGTDSKSKIVYSDYIIDTQGNWIQRKATWFYEVNGKSKNYTKMEFQVIVYY